MRTGRASLALLLAAASLPGAAAPERPRLPQDRPQRAIEADVRKDAGERSLAAARVAAAATMPQGASAPELQQGTAASKDHPVPEQWSWREEIVEDCSPPQMAPAQESALERPEGRWLVSEPPA